MKKSNKKCGGKMKKYQVGGISNIPEIKPLNNSLSLSPQQELTPQFPDQLNVLEGTGNLEFHPLFKLFNILAQATTGIANKAGDIGTDIRNRKKNIEALQQPNFKNTTTEGLNDAPAYYKAGGKWKLKKQTGGRLIPEDQVGSYTKRGYIPMENKPNYYRKEEAVAGNLASAPTTTNVGGGDAYNKKLIELLQQGHTIDDLAAKGYGTPEGLQQFSQYYKPTEDIVYTQPTKPQPTHIDLGVRMFDGNAAIGDAGWREQTGTTTNPGTQNKFWNFQPIDAAGNPTQDFYENIPDDEWYNATSGHNRLSKDTLPSFEKYKRAPVAKLQTGGETQTAEVEEGEMVETTDGDINKVPEGSGTHEEGGVDIPEVERVLEDTSDKRKDKASKVLKLQPKTVEAILGFKPKTSLSHAKAHEKAIEFYNKKSKAIISKVDKNLKSTKENDSNKYAYNSLKFNASTMEKLPSEQDMFDTLFDHQEKVKSLFGIQDNGNKKQTGGYDVWKGDKRKTKNPLTGEMSNTWNASPFTNLKAAADYIGYPSDLPLTPIHLQNYLMKKAPNEVKDVMDLYGAPNAGVFNDNKLGVRFKRAAENYVNKTLPNKPNTEPLNANSVTGVPDINLPSNNVNETLTTNTTPNYERDNKFNFPLKWYDIAAPLGDYLGSNKAHINYNPIDVHQLQLQQLNPLPTLQRGQSDFNEELNALRSTGVNGGVQLANIGNLYAKKYAMNNEVLGNYANANAEIKNKEIMYNTQAADRQSVANAQSRDIFEQKNLATDEAVRQQKLTDSENIFSKIAQNKKFNFEGNLLMKLFPNYTPTGDYNGRRYNFRNPINSSNGDIDDVLISNNINPQGLTPNQKANFLAKILKSKK